MARVHIYKKPPKNKVIRHVKKALILSDRGPLQRELKNNEFLMPSGPQKARVSEALPKFQCLLFGHSRDFFLGQV